jgi:hypothetical protein
VFRRQKFAYALSRSEIPAPLWGLAVPQPFRRHRSLHCVDGCTDYLACCIKRITRVGEGSKRLLKSLTLQRTLTRQHAIRMGCSPWVNELLSGTSHTFDSYLTEVQKEVRQVLLGLLTIGSMASRCRKYTWIALVFILRSSGFPAESVQPDEFLQNACPASLGLLQDFRG